MKSLLKIKITLRKIKIQSLLELQLLITNCQSLKINKILIITFSSQLNLVKYLNQERKFSIITKKIYKNKNKYSRLQHIKFG